MLYLIIYILSTATIATTPTATTKGAEFGKLSWVPVKLEIIE